jgi:hypothetical protein
MNPVTARFLNQADDAALALARWRTAKNSRVLREAGRKASLFDAS